MKATGAEITAFWLEWPPGVDWYVDDGTLEVLDEHDQPLLDPAQKYAVEDIGVLCWQGLGPAPKGAEDGVAIKTAFAKWRKARTHQTMVVAVPNVDADEFKALCKQRGWGIR